MRDLEKDLEICRAATPGPWEIADDLVYGLPTLELSSPASNSWIAQVLDKDIDGKANATFIAAAREGWPHAIERAIAAEAKLAAAEKVCEAAKEYLESQDYHAYMACSSSAVSNRETLKNIADWRGLLRQSLAAYEEGKE